MLQEQYNAGEMTSEQKKQGEVGEEAVDFDTVHAKELVYDPDFYREEIKAAMKLEGSVPERTQGAPQAYHNVEEARQHQKECVHAIHAERLAELEKLKATLEGGNFQGNENMSQKDLLLLTNREINNIETALLYDELDGHTTAEPMAESLYDKMQEMFQVERYSLEADIKSNAVKVRDIELQKMACEGQIHWIQKQIWELQVESSPEKTALQEQITRIQQEKILPLAKEALVLLRQEETSLASKTTIPAWTMEQRYVYGAAAEFVHLVQEIEATLPKKADASLSVEQADTKMAA